jgi:hypothetical protein
MTINDNEESVDCTDNIVEKFKLKAVKDAQETADKSEIFSAATKQYPNGVIVGDLYGYIVDVMKQ